MGRHSKNRKYQWAYPPQYMPPMVPMSMGGPMFPFPPPPPLIAPPFLPFPPSPRPAPSPRESLPPQQNKFESQVERACLPRFSAEYRADVASSITDIVIMDFDRSLLATPALNLDLVDKDSRYVLESRIGLGSGWWQSPAVLDAALELANWDATLLEMARAASQSPTAALVITTYRPGNLAPRIHAALAAQGVENVAHFACSTGSHFTMGSKAKQQQLDVLLEAYASVERVFVYDANSADRKAYDQAAYGHIKSGTFEAETFRIVNLYMARRHFPPLQERQLIEKLVEAAPAAITASIVVTGWRHMLDPVSRKVVLDWVASIVPEIDITQLLSGDISILSGSLLPELRPHVGDPGSKYQWRLGGYEIHGRTLYLYALPLGQPPLAEPYTDNGAKFEGARLAKATDVPYTAVNNGPEFTTVVYEGRVLRVHETKR